MPLHPLFFSVFQQVFGAEDSDIDSPTKNSVPDKRIKDFDESNVPVSEEKSLQKSNEISSSEKETPSPILSSESHQTMGDILSSMSAGLSSSLPGPGPRVENAVNRPSASSPKNVKRPAFWGHNSVCCY